MAASRQSPLVLCMEDLHWADRDTLELLWSLSRHLRNAAIMTIATFRMEDVHRGASALRDAAAPPARLSDRTVPHRGAQSARDRGTDRIQIRRFQPELIANRTGVQKAIRCTSSNCCAICMIGGSWRWTRRVAGCHPRTTLESRASCSTSSCSVSRGSDQMGRRCLPRRVVGHEWELAVVETVLAWDEERLLTILQDALASNMVVPSTTSGETYRFSHSLWREVLYGQLVMRRRKQIHQQVVAVLEQEFARSHDEAMYAALASQSAAAEDWPRSAAYALRRGRLVAGPQRHPHGAALL